MDCRKLWANYFGGSDMKFDKEFPKDKSIIGDGDIP